MKKRIKNYKLKGTIKFSTLKRKGILPSEIRLYIEFKNGLI